MNRARGMSLLELLMVLVLVATLAGIGATVIGRQLPGRELHDAARTVAGELRFARARAIATGRPQVFVIDVNTRSWQGADERKGTLPEGLDVVATTAREERPARDQAAVRFFPEGAATGGRIVIKRGGAAWRVDVAWLTGEVTLSRGEGPA
ncbi:GspH/FimT family protein [Arenimonas aestuarii]